MAPNVGFSSFSIVGMRFLVALAPWCIQQKKKSVAHHPGGHFQKPLIVSKEATFWVACEYLRAALKPLRFEARVLIPRAMEKPVVEKERYLAYFLYFPKKLQHFPSKCSIIITHQNPPSKMQLLGHWELSRWAESPSCSSTRLIKRKRRVRNTF